MFMSEQNNAINLGDAGAFIANSMYIVALFLPDIEKNQVRTL